MRLRPYVRAGNVALGWCVACLLVLVFFTNLPLVANLRTGLSVAPLAYAALLGLALLVAAANPAAALGFLRTGFARWSLALLALYAITWWRVRAGQGDGAWDIATREDLDIALDRMQLFLLCPAFAFLAWRVPPGTFRAFLGLIAFVAPALVLVDFFVPGSFSGLLDDNLVTSQKTRVGGPWDNPNAGGEAVVLALLMARGALSRRLMVVAFTLAGAALILTGSRSGIAAYLGVGAWYLWQGVLPRYYVAVPIVFVLSFAAVVNVLEDVAVATGRESGLNDVIGRLSVFGEGDRDELDDGSTQTRGEVARYSLAAIAEAPLIGHGIDYIDPVSETETHNMLLAMGYTFGLSGLLLWAALAWLLMRGPDGGGSLRPSAAALVFVWYSLFTHNILENNHWLVFFAVTLFAGVRSNAPLLALPRAWQARSRRHRRRSAHVRSRSATRGVPSG